MSFQEVRSFVQAMKSLGYPRVVSLDNFRAPNFELVADCLLWLVHRFYPESVIADDIATEAERVAFLQSVAQLMLTKARVRLNTKRLYAADGAAVRELLKLAGLLRRAAQSTEQGDEEPAEAADIGAALRALDVRAAKAAASEMARAGAALHDALASEPSAREARARALAGAAGADAAARAVAEARGGAEDAAEAARAQVAELAAAAEQLDAQLERRRGELERAEKRLATLAAVRPAYADEYEALEGQLQTLFAHYLERHRNLEFLEAQLEGYKAAERVAAEAEARRLRRVQKRLAEEELRILRGEQPVDESRLGGTTTSSSGGSSRGSSAAAGAGGAADGARRDQGTGLGLSRRGLGGAAAPTPAVVGTLAGGGAGGWDEEEEPSIDEDTGSEGGDLELLGSEGGSGGGEGDGAGADAGGEEGEEGLGLGIGGGEVLSEDSGF
ncbi:hypothetical protein Rsub_09918 [Raphidocelis subcapitata]|uniref:Clusterin-associated protein 1 n=1 Tax=Raphidocelis subcapitata TaxID=307507 RepID=A0A2V0PG88_9CHLO|nr:hypothetical protein Rsub_09918 [Raphidocelis subcapitata]|eukprot:GBF96913.1 hypothetical protein Rsub_09918 [Raphidocelis subcapitata]